MRRGYGGYRRGRGVLIDHFISVYQGNDYKKRFQYDVIFAIILAFAVVVLAGPFISMHAGSNNLNTMSEAELSQTNFGNINYAACVATGASYTMRVRQGRYGHRTVTVVYYLVPTQETNTYIVMASDTRHLKDISTLACANTLQAEKIKNSAGVKTAYGKVVPVGSSFVQNYQDEFFATTGESLAAVKLLPYGISTRNVKKTQLNLMVGVVLLCLCIFDAVNSYKKRGRRELTDYEEFKMREALNSQGISYDKSMALDDDFERWERENQNNNF